MRWDQGEAKRTIERILSLAGPGDWALELTAPVGSQVRRVMELCGLTTVVTVRPEA